MAAASALRYCLRQSKEVMKKYELARVLPFALGALTSVEGLKEAQDSGQILYPVILKLAGFSFY